MPRDDIDSGARPWRVGEVVQLGDNAQNPMLAYCFMVVTEARDWGAIGYIPVPGQDGKPAGRAYYRARHDEMMPTGGDAVWMPA
jgi:hypothetical protein